MSGSALTLAESSRSPCARSLPFPFFFCNSSQNVSTPLAVADARTVGEHELVPTALIYPNRRGETLQVRYGEGHRWYYKSGMEPGEVLLIKCFDSKEDGRARRVPHTAFEDPGAEEGAGVHLPAAEGAAEEGVGAGRLRAEAGVEGVVPTGLRLHEWVEVAARQGDASGAVEAQLPGEMGAREAAVGLNATAQEGAGEVLVGLLVFQEVEVVHDTSPFADQLHQRYVVALAL